MPLLQFTVKVMDMDIMVTHMALDMAMDMVMDIKFALIRHDSLLS